MFAIPCIPTKDYYKTMFTEFELRYICDVSIVDWYRYVNGAKTKINILRRAQVVSSECVIWHLVKQVMSGDKQKQVI